MRLGSGRRHHVCTIPPPASTTLRLPEDSNRVLGMKPFMPDPQATTNTSSALERIEFGSSALSRCKPTFPKVRVAFPSVPVDFPPTLAPEIGLPVAPSVTMTVTGRPFFASLGPASLRKWDFENASKAQRILSVFLTSCWHPPTGVNAKFRSMPQNLVDV